MNVLTIDQMLQNYRIYFWDPITGIWFNRNLNLHVWSASTLRAWLPPVKDKKKYINQTNIEPATNSKKTLKSKYKQQNTLKSDKTFFKA